MTAIRREHILDLPSYERSRAELRPAVLEAKRRRRVHLAGALTFLFLGGPPPARGTGCQPHEGCATGMGCN